MVNRCWNTVLQVSRKKYLRDYAPYLLPLVLTVFALHKLIFNPGHLLWGEFLSAIDYSFWLQEFLKPWSIYSSLGHSNLGFPEVYGYEGFGVITPYAYILWLSFMSILQFIFGSWVYLVYIGVVLFIPFFGMYHFIRFIYPKAKTRLIWLLPALIYGMNPQVSDRIISGTLRYNLAYGILPLCLLFTFKGIKEKNFKKKLLNLFSSALLCSVLFQIMPHFIFLYGLILLGYFFFICKNRKEFFKYILPLFLVFNILIAYIVIPALVYKQDYPFYPEPFYNMGALIQASKFTHFTNVLTMSVSSEENLLLVEEMPSWILEVRMIVPAFFVIVSLILGNFSRKFYLSIFLITIGVVLSMGVKPPFEAIYTHMYQQIPLFKPFRDPTKFLVLYIFGFSLLISYVLSKLQQFARLLWYLFGGSLTLLLISNPVFLSGNFKGVIVPFELPYKYESLYQKLEQKESTFRVTFLPYSTTFSDYDWYAVPLKPTGRNNIYSGISHLPVDLAIPHGNLYMYSHRYLYYLHSNLDQDWAIKRMGLEGIKYIIIDESVIGYEEYKDLLKNKDSLREVKFQDGFVVFEVETYQPFETREIALVFYYGANSILPFIDTSNDLVDLGITENSKIISEVDSIVLFNQKKHDLFLATLMDYEIDFFPEIKFKKSAFSPMGNHIKDYLKDGLITYNPKGIYSRGAGIISKDVLMEEGKIYRIYVSYLSHPTHTSSIQITVGEENFILKDLYKNEFGLYWVGLGEIDLHSGNSSISVANLEDKPFYLDRLVVISSAEFDLLYKNFSKSIANTTFVELSNLDDAERLNISIQGVTVPYSYMQYADLCSDDLIVVNYYKAGSLCDVFDQEIDYVFVPSNFARIMTFVSLGAHMILISLLVFILFKL